MFKNSLCFPLKQTDRKDKKKKKKSPFLLRSLYSLMSEKYGSKPLKLNLAPWATSNLSQRVALVCECRCSSPRLAVFPDRLANNLCKM